MAKARMTKKEKDNKTQQAFLMYMGFVEQKDIAEILGLSEKTISSWVTEGKWKEKRSARTVTRDELINKTLQAIGQMLDNALASEDKNFNAITDGLNKMANTIEKLDKKNNIIHIMECFMGFNDDLMLQMKTNKAITPEFIKTINKYQNSYVHRRMNNE